MKGRLSVVINHIIVVVLLSTVPVYAFDFMAPVVTPFKDPLFANPQILDSGRILPGDSRPVTCPYPKEFTIPLTLTDAVDMALCNNPQLKAAWASIKVQASAVGDARSAYLPTLSGSTNFMRTRTTYPGSVIAASATEGKSLHATLGWRLFDFGGREANRQSANSLLAAAITYHDAALQKKLSEVIQAYFDALTMKALLQAKEQNENISRSTFETSQRREARGAVARSDVLQASTALAKSTLEKNRAIGAYNKTLSVLVYILGIPANTRIILSDDLKDKEFMDSNSLDEWLKLAAESHPAILSVRAQLESAKQKVTATRSEGLPTLDLMASYYQNGYPGQGLSPTQSQVTTIGFSITFPLFEGFSRTYKIRGAEAQVEQRTAELLDTEHNTLMEVVKAHADAAASLQNLEASWKLLDAARESLSVSQRKYDKGAADILELLNTQSALADAEQERVRCLAEWRSARLRLLASTGVMGSKGYK
jgi:outer membrane protein